MCRRHLLPLLLLPSLAVAAGDEWFGAKLPGQAAPRLERDWNAYRQPDFPPLDEPVTGQPDPYRAIRPDEVYRHLADIVRIANDSRPPGEPFWGRIAGSEAERRTAGYVADQFRAGGLENVRLEQVRGGAQWWPTGWRVTLLKDGTGAASDYVLTSAFPGLHLGEGALKVDALDAELVYVGLGQPADLAGRSLAGRIAVVRSVMQADPFFHTARGIVPDLVKAGAVGVIVAMDAPGNFQYALEGLASATVPTFVVGGEDGRFLQQVLGAAGSRPVRMRLSLHSEIRKSWEGLNAVGEIPGQTDDVVLVIAHLDGYFDAANDNAGGVAALAALGQYFGQRGKLPNRRHVFVGTSGHHEFSDGVKQFIAAHPDLLARTRLVVNLEHPSSLHSYYRGPLRIGPGIVPGQLTTTNVQGTRSVSISNGNARLLSIYQDAIARYAMTVDAMANRMPTGDAFDFHRAGLPVVQIIDTNLWFHSSGDRPDTIDPAGLARATRLQASILDAIDRESSAALGLEPRR